MSGPTKYCDLVMKGGITSGVVYPNAVLTLKQDFRFKNIGGTSAGAIAAAATAAAAMGDRLKIAGTAFPHDADKVGFEGLQLAARQLATEGFIYSLFQPVGGTRAAFRLIVTLAGNAGGFRKLITLLATVILIAPIEAAAILALLLGIGFYSAGAQGIWGALLPSLLCSFAGAAFCGALRVARAMRKNMLGICSGRKQQRPWYSLSAGGPKPGLTDWMHNLLQELSGKAFDQPLTFEDLWETKRYDNEPITPRAINLQMITTDVSHHEPRTLPFTEGGFWFRQEEFLQLFPEAVVEAMKSGAGAPLHIEGHNYYKLPPGGHLPVLVGMRMSLSFPFLISAVPLHEPETRGKPSGDGPEAEKAETRLTESMEGLSTGGERGAANITSFRVCWFSDGGISSNFPIHLFDAPLPSWPTFAINLLYPKVDKIDRFAASNAPVADGEEHATAGEAAVFLPVRNNQGWQRTYQSIAATVAAKELSSFIFGVIATMQNWRDLLQSRAPGQRDRIVHISLTGEEGGLNLNMPQKILDGISGKGTLAGDRLKTFSFENHYWIRWRNLASAYQRYLIRLAEGDARSPKIADYVDAYQTAKTGAPPAPSYAFGSTARTAEAQQLLSDLLQQGNVWMTSDLDLGKGAPRPSVQMGITLTY
ncbi:MAG: RpoH suppressor [Rhizobium sp.]|nr:RpoH suppressor [Rhizobium sp.]